MKYLAKLNVPRKFRPGTILKNILLKTSGKQLFSERLKGIFLLKYIFIFFTFGSFYNFLQLLRVFTAATHFVIIVKRISLVIKFMSLSYLAKKNSFQILFKFISNSLRMQIRLFPDLF